MVLQLIVEILVIDRLKDTPVILCLLSKVFLDTVVGETLTVFSMPQIWKTGQCLAGQFFADYCTRILTKFGLVMIELFIILPG